MGWLGSALVAPWDMSAILLVVPELVQPQLEQPPLHRIAAVADAKLLLRRAHRHLRAQPRVKVERGSEGEDGGHPGEVGGTLGATEAVKGVGIVVVRRDGIGGVFNARRPLLLLLTHPLFSSISS